MANEKNDPTGTLVITRKIAAPRELVFDAFTKLEHLSKWWGPKGFDLTVLKLEAKPGGHFHFRMSADDFSMYGQFTFIEIQKPVKLVFINGFANAQGEQIRNPVDDNWPMEMYHEILFTEESGSTLLTLSVGAHNASPSEIQTFINGFGDMQQGYAGTFDKLDELFY